MTTEAMDRTALPCWISRLRLPVIAAPMFLLSGPDLVIAAARAGIVGAFPTLNARTPAILRTWLERIVREVREGGGESRGAWAANVIAHRTNPRFDADVDLLVEFEPPMVISALGLHSAHR